MPELPEVETTKRGIAPHIIGKTIENVIVRQRQLRWLITPDFETNLIGATIETVQRRAKYLLLKTSTNTLIAHLGMSGHLRIVNRSTAIGNHDHVDIIFDDDTVLRFNDQRRFGALVLATGNVMKHSLLRDLGVEPLSDDFTAQQLFQLSRRRRVPTKTFLMTGKVVVGVGNIYANEALFMAGILPTRHAGELSLLDCEKLVACIREVLARAIEQGGTTLRDFVNADGKAGYFQQQLHVYGRGTQPCTHCTQPLQEIRLANRSTVFCSHCQQ
ncbi:MAG: bifunctional DNA-formamidopyrimidine glycosylase/DNA-(apurinic or apyrimidinic site) lyase [Methylococcales bacterium]|nr:bifunctional DNA-formamidopyrimidine glycosylase/DNA-(apurinic or apyrimidinic site) lyase [Methylococcales bacterium]MDD5755605.1 bifunctional DNA-formamidopyrimidine glycosylase/DNA-(apurinic or apyrimidinic site) lyase [Methylococcales bacterium]